MTDGYGEVVRVTYERRWQEHKWQCAEGVMKLTGWLRSRAARIAGCPWCEWLQVDPLWPSCMCRADCGRPNCNRRWSVLAIDLEPGMRIVRDDNAELATVRSVTDPDRDGMVFVTPEQGSTWRVASDWQLHYAERAA